MRKVAVGLLGLSLTATGLAVGPSASAAPQPKQPTSAPSVAEPAHADHDLPNPLEDKRRALRQEGLSEVLSGKAKAQRINGSTVVKVGKTRRRAGATGPHGRAAARPARKDQYVELSREQTDQIFVILAEFGNERHPDYPDKDTDPDTPGPSRFDGPLHNEIPEPNRAVDNSTVWQAGLQPGPLPQALLRHQAGRRVAEAVLRGPVLGSVQRRRRGHRLGQGQVQRGPVRPVQRPDRRRRPGRRPGGLRQQRLQQHLGAGPRRRQPVGRRPEGRRAAPTRRSPPTCKSFDKWDRYDFDGDGNFNESDGYIDHFQIVHAGGDQADGDP